MKLSIGIVGLPNVGKSTLFNILTEQSVVAANYPFATIDPNVGIVSVPDSRIDELAEISKSAERIPAVVEFYDIAGLVEGAHKGEGLGNQFLTHIRETDALCMVLRVFQSSDIIHVDGSVDALRDLNTIETELVLKDFETVERRLEKVSRDAKSGAKEAVEEQEALQRVYRLLADGQTLFSNFEIISLIRANKRIKELNLLTAKRQLFLLNGAKEDVSDELMAAIEERGGAYIVSDLGDRSQTTNASESTNGITELIEKAYEALGLISFFTTGEKETRAWTIRQGAKAPEAAGAIHSDFEEKFIRAEVVSYEDFVELGGWSGARGKGKARVEGREYEMKDGDVVLIRHG